MEIVTFKVTLSILFISSLCEGLDLNTGRKYNPTNDFLLHETQGATSPPKRDYISQFPPLTPPSQKPQNINFNSDKPLLQTQQTTSPPWGNRPQQSTGKRDYVAPQFPPLGPASSTPRSSHTSLDPLPKTETNKNIQPSGKRDYVAPQINQMKPTPSISPVNPQGGKVKDLINFYDTKPGGQNPSSPPSYSSILRGKSEPSPSTPSSVTSNTNKNTSPVTQPHSKSTTPQPSSTLSLKPGSTIGVNNRNTSPTTRPIQLPSSLVNNNQKGPDNGPSDTEIQSLSEDLLKKDTNNAAKFITINIQGKTTSESKKDEAPQPLLLIPDNVWNIPTIQKFVPLLDNYERDTLVNEYVTPQERNEENAFMDAIMSTTVIRHLMNFLKLKGYVTPDPKQQRDFLKQLWFNLYSRGKGKISSSGFEHVFVSELKNGEVSGLHNWIYFSREETANRANYLGYLKYVQLNDKGAVLKLHFNQLGADKPVDSMFIGTSPELEIALYTLCFVTRADKDCKLKLNGKDVKIVTHTFRYRSKNLIGSAFPQI